MYEGNLVRLRAFEAGDADANHAFMNDYETVRGMLSGLPLPSSMQDERDWRNRQTSMTSGAYQFAVEDADGDLVGRCGPLKVDWKNSCAELGLMIGTPYRRRGYGREAMTLLTRFCFEEMNLHRVEVRVMAFNTAALRCYEAVGFRREGVIRKQVFRAGSYHDVVVLGLLREEWQ